MHPKSPFRLVLCLLACLVTSVLYACGGSASSTSPSATSTSILVQGTATSTEPMAGARVIVKDRTGAVVGVGTTNGQGGFSFETAGSAPFVAQVWDGKGTTLYGVGQADSVEATPVTSGLLALWYKAQGTSLDQAFAGLGTGSPVPEPGAFRAAIDSMVTSTTQLLENFGIDRIDPEYLAELCKYLTFELNDTTLVVTVTQPDGSTESAQLVATSDGQGGVQFKGSATFTASGPAYPEATNSTLTCPLSVTVPAAAATVGNDAWMKQMADTLGPKRLADVVLPGTHDSGTSGIDDPTGPNTALTQTKNIGEQLRDGIRYFDFRVREVAHKNCADPSVFWFYHGQTFGEAGLYHDSYRVKDALAQIKAYCEETSPTGERIHAREMIVLDFQNINLKYSDGRATGVLIRSVYDQLSAYLLPFDDNLVYGTVGPQALTLNGIWATNDQRKEQRQIVVLFPQSQLNNGQGCGDPYPARWFGARETYLMSAYHEREYSNGLKTDLDVQLSSGFATTQGRLSEFNAYKSMQTTHNLRVLQIVPRPSDSWFGLYAFFGRDSLLNYGLFINGSFNDCPSGTSGWLGQRMWAAMSGINYQGPWNKPNIIIVDNYTGVSKPTVGLPDPKTPVNWRSMRWTGATWMQTNANNTGYVDFVKSLNTIPAATVDPGVTTMDDNTSCYQY